MSNTISDLVRAEAIPAKRVPHVVSNHLMRTQPDDVEHRVRTLLDRQARDLGLTVTSVTKSDTEHYMMLGVRLAPFQRDETVFWATFE